MNSEPTEFTHTTSTYIPLTPRIMVQLMAPHTWPASITPVLLAMVLTLHDKPENLSLAMVFLLLAISILMQSAVNTFNDYSDFVKGADSADNQVDPEDAALVFNHVNPRSVLVFFVALLGIAFCLGIQVILHAGWIPLAIGAVGAAVIYLYSGGKLPLSYMPIGELASGFVMGGLITLACVHVLTGEFSWLPLFFSLPLILGIGMIMFTNNTCDIEKDREAGRHTLSAIVGRTWARRLYRTTVLAWLAVICVLVGIYFPAGAVILPFMILTSYPLLRALLCNPLVLETRIAAMAQVLSVNIVLANFYCLAILTDTVSCCLK